MTLVLDTTSKLLEILIDAGGSAADIIFTGHWMEYTSATPVITPGSQDGTSNGVTPVTVVAAPASGSIRMCSAVTIYNAGSVSHTVTFRLNLGGGTTRILCAPILVQAGASINLVALAQQGANGVLSANVSDEVAYTPTMTGFGTPTSVTFTWRRVGDCVRIEGKFTSGTSTGVPTQIPLPSGLTIDSTKQPVIGIRGMGCASFATTTNVFFVLATGGLTYLQLGNNGLGGLTASNASSMVSSGQTISFFAEVPVLGWTSLSAAASAALVSQIAYDQLSVNVTAQVTKTGNATLTSADLATWLHFGDGSAQSITLPAASTCAKGTKLALYNASTVSGSSPVVHTFTRAGSDNIVGSTGNLTAVQLLSTNFCVLESDGVSLWIIRQSRFDTGWLDGGAVTITGSSSNPAKGSPIGGDHMWWRRVGHDIEIRMWYRQTGAGTSGSGNYQFTIAGGFTADSAVMNISEDIGWGTGYAQSTAGGNTVAVGNMVSGSPTKFLLQYQSTIVSTMTTVGSGNFKLGDAVAIFYMHGFLPISGWAV